ncbi:MAG: hypothetical protein PHG23_02495 [Candidatus Pacebacteria bacterium]|nr:hypothetical protein [Candidatus Paceibacterota bacterium]
MNKKIIYAIIAIIIIIIVVVVCVGLRGKTPGFGEEINFSHTGNLVINNPGLEPGQWYFIYEAPGAPALKVKLSFSGSTACKNEMQQTLACSEIEVQGARVAIQGHEDDGVVSVQIMNVSE